MPEAGKHHDSLRFNRFESERLVIALTVSIIAHLLLFGGYEAGKIFHLWKRTNRITQAAKLLQQQIPQEQPLVFVTVDQPSTEAPKDAKYYSDKNSKAANPDTSHNTDVVRIDGHQMEVPKTQDSQAKQVTQSQPTPQTTQVKTSPQPLANTGDLAMMRPQDLQPKPEQERPRKLSQVQNNPTPGVAMKQDGGVQEHAAIPSLGVKLTGFGDYDARFYEAVCQRWWDLLNSQKFALDRTGKVVLQFKLNYDGSVSDMKVANNEVGDLLGYVCQKAIFDPAPFAKWTSEMRVKLGDSRDVQFTFYYY